MTTSLRKEMEDLLDDRGYIPYTDFVIIHGRYQKELEEMWETGQYKKLPPLE